MILSKLVIKWIYWRHGADVSDDVTTTKAIRHVNDKMFLCIDTSMSTSDSLQNNLTRKTCLIIVTDVYMTSNRAFFLKSNCVANFNDPKKWFYLNTTIIFVVFCHNDNHG